MSSFPPDMAVNIDCGHTLAKAERRPNLNTVCRTHLRKKLSLVLTPMSISGLLFPHLPVLAPGYRIQCR